MIQNHPIIAAAVAEEHRRTLMAEAEAARLARAARDGGDARANWPARWFAPRRHPRIARVRSRLARLRPAPAR